MNKEDPDYIVKIEKAIAKKYGIKKKKKNTLSS